MNQLTLISPKKTLQEVVFPRLSHIEDIIEESDNQPLYCLLQKLYSSFPSSQGYYQQQKLICQCLRVMIEVDNISDISSWITTNLQLEIDENDVAILKDYVKVCSYHKDFTIDDYSVLIPPSISQYPTWCKKLRYLRSLPPRRIPKDKLSSTPRTSRLTPRTSKNTPNSTPTTTPRIYKIPPLQHANTSPCLIKSSPAISLPSLPSHHSSVNLSAVASISTPSVPAQIRLLSIENNKIRQEVWKVLGIH